MKLHRASTNTPIKLGQELGRGGEGAVFTIASNAALVAKIYSKPPTAEKIEKLASMARAAKPSLLNVAAWPTDLLLDEKRTVRGFLMPKVSSRATLHELYSPKSRVSAFPEMDFRFLVRATANIARAFAFVHAQGHVIGDVNHGNALVGRDGTIVLIDCDSFQIRDRIRIFPCDVGVPLFTAPELQGKAFRGLRRSANHDAFGLAVVIFHMLFQGRHPFAGVYADGEITIERAIAEHRFAYSTTPEHTHMRAPPGTLALDAFGDAIAALFTQAFQQPASLGSRPTAFEWIDALEALERSLTQCTTSPTHYFPGEGACCWCSVEGRTGLQLFGRRLASAARSAGTDVEALWRAVMEIPHPGPAPRPDLESPKPTMPSGTSRIERFVARPLNQSAMVGLVASSLMLVAGFVNEYVFMVWLACVAVGVTTYTGMKRRSAVNHPLKQAQKTWHAILDRWNNECSGAKFDEVLADLKQARLELTLLVKRRKSEVERAIAEATQEPLRKYLSAFPIQHLPVNDLTRSQRMKLAAYGIKTAADVDRDQSIIPSLVSKKAARELLAWYRMHLRGFQPITPHPAQLAAIERRFDYHEQRLATKLIEGRDRLRQSREQIIDSRRRLESSLERAWKDLSRAQQQAE